MIPFLIFNLIFNINYYLLFNYLLFNSFIIYLFFIFYYLLFIIYLLFNYSIIHFLNLIFRPFKYIKINPFQNL